MKRILVGCLQCGENERGQSIDSVASQDYPDFHIEQFVDFTDIEGHNLLYQTFEKNAHAYDIFVKLDGDMVMEDDHTLARIADQYERSPNLDRLVIDLWDVPSVQFIPCLQTFSNRCRWPALTDPLHPDRAPQYPGAMLRLRGMSDFHISHMPNASDFQMFAYGIHSAIKCVQWTRPVNGRSWERANYHYSVLRSIYRHMLIEHSERDLRRLYCILGAEEVFRGSPSYLLNNYKQDAARGLFTRIGDMVRRMGRSAVITEMLQAWNTGEVYAMDRLYELLHNQHQWKTSSNFPR